MICDPKRASNLLPNMLKKVNCSRDITKLIPGCIDAFCGKKALDIYVTSRSNTILLIALSYLQKPYEVLNIKVNGHEMPLKPSEVNEHAILHDMYL